MPLEAGGSCVYVWSTRVQEYPLSARCSGMNKVAHSEEKRYRNEADNLCYPDLPDRSQLTGIGCYGQSVEILSRSERLRHDPSRRDPRNYRHHHRWVRTTY